MKTQEGFRIQRLLQETAGIQDSGSKLYKRIPEAELSISTSNIKNLTTFVGQRGELVSDIRKGKRSLDIMSAEERADWRAVSHISLYRNQWNVDTTNFSRLDEK